MNLHAEKLFHLCLQVLREHAKIIDSLVGLPEIVGEQLFRFFEESGLFDKPSVHSAHVLRVFVQAYGPALLNVFSCHSHHILSDQLDHLNVYLQSITCLELSFCHLGSNHEVFRMIAQSPTLETVYLRQCALTDASMRNTSLSTNLLESSKINTFDLSRNIRNLGYLLTFAYFMCLENSNLTSKSYSSLSRFLQLKILVLSSDQQELIKTITQRGFLPEKVSLTIPSLKGWAASKLALSWQNSIVEIEEKGTLQAFIREPIRITKLKGPPRKKSALISVEEMLIDSD